MRTLTYLLAGLLLLSTNTLASQIDDGYRHQIELGTDNDYLIVYTSTDRYYTYGVNGTYRWQPKKENLFSRIFKTKEGYYQTLGLNLEAYTPSYRGGNENEDIMERPYAGWAYAELQSTYTFEKSFLRLGIDAGIMGPDSQAGAFQNWFHDLTGDTQVDWSNQIGNFFGFNLKGRYARTLYGTKSFDIYGLADASLGNIYVYLDPSVSFRLGKFNPIQRSIAQHNELLADRTTKEFFFELNGGMRISAINATIQGDIFDGQRLFSQDDIENLVFHAHMGLFYTGRRFSYSLRYVYSSGEIVENRSHRYAMVTAAYRFD